MRRAVQICTSWMAASADRHRTCPLAEIALQHSAHVLAQVDTIITEIDEVALIAVGCAALDHHVLSSSTSVAGVRDMAHRSSLQWDHC